MLFAEMVATGFHPSPSDQALLGFILIGAFVLEVIFGGKK